MDAVGALSLLLIVIAALAAVGGYIAGVLRQRRQRPVRAYFMLGVVTGFVAAVVARGRLDRLAPVARRLVVPRRLDNPLAIAALQVRRSVSRAGITR